jgi:excisionase family DNA binding protein
MLLHSAGVSDEELLTVDDVARQLKLHPETVRRWIRSGKLRAISLGSDRAGLRIRASEIQRLLGGDDHQLKRAA